MKSILKRSWLVLLFHALLNVIIALLLIWINTLTATSSARLVGVFAFVSGLTLVWVSLFARPGSLIMMITGLLSAAPGCWMIFFPEGLIDNKWYLVAYALVAGIISFLLAYKIRRTEKEIRIHVDQFERQF